MGILTTIPLGYGFLLVSTRLLIHMRTRTVLGFMFFFIVEKLMRIIRGGEGHSHRHSHSHQHKHPPQKKAKSSEAESDEESDDERSESDASKKKKLAKEESTHIVDSPPKIRIAAILNLVADAMHNFTDGLAIGAS